MRNLLSTLVLASVGLVLSTGDASAFFRKKKKCQPAPVVTHVADPCDGMPSYSGSSYSSQQSAFPTYPQANYGNSGYGYNNSGFGNSGFGNSGFGNSGFGNSGFGAGQSLLGTVGSVGSGILSAPGNLYNRIR